MIHLYKQKLGNAPEFLLKFCNFMYIYGHSSFTADMIIELAHFFNTTPNVLLNFDSSTEITDANLVKLCKFVKDENIDVDALIELINACKNLNS